MSIALIIIMQAAVIHGTKCAGDFEYSGQFSYANLECQSLTTQVYAHPQIDAGAAHIEVNGQVFDGCAMEQVTGFADGEVLLYFQCPTQASLRSRP